MKLLVCLALLLVLVACASTSGLTIGQDMTAAGAAVVAAVTASAVSTPIGGAIVGGVTWLVGVLFMGRQPFEVHGTTAPLAGAPMNPEPNTLSWVWWGAILFVGACVVVYFIRRTDFLSFVWDALPGPKKTRSITTEGDS